MPPTFVVRNWKTIGWYIKKALPEHLVEHVFQEGNLIKAVETGMLVVWSAYAEGKLMAVATTMIGADAIVGPRTVTVYTLSAVKKLPEGFLEKALKSVNLYAKSVGAKVISFYIGSELFAKRFEDMGFKRSYVLTKEVE